MKVLVVGSGGREHAIAWKLSLSSKVQEVIVAPGNGGMESFCKCVPIGVNQFDELVQLAKEEKVDLTVIGPEDPLSSGIVDYFEEQGLLVFGPSRLASQLEGSKDFCREICSAAGVPIAEGKTFSDYDLAKDYILEKGAPIVVKADGLAAGKGVVVASSTEEAMEALSLSMVDKKFGQAGDKVVIEECLKGQEVSILALCSGTDAVTLDPSQDHKRIFDGDQGPNTGGMGTFSPVPFFSQSQKEWVENTVILPVLEEMKRRNMPFKGVMFVGLMIEGDDIRVLEINVRFGDPETQSVLPRLEGDLFEIMYKAAKGESISGLALGWSPLSCVTVVAASEGYPGNYPKGKTISGYKGPFSEGVQVFHAGTKKEGEVLVTSGGRVLCVSALGEDLREAKKKSYEGLQGISFDGIFYRKDISDKALI